MNEDFKERLKEITLGKIEESFKGQEELLKNFNDTTKTGVKWFFSYVEELLKQPFGDRVYLHNNGAITNTDMGYVCDFIDDFKTFLVKEGLFEEGE